MTVQSSNIASSYWALKDSNTPSAENSLENTVQKRIANLIISIKYLLTNENHLSIYESFVNLFDDVFSLRQDSFKLINSKDLEIENLFDSIYESFINRDIPDKYELLIENVLFSLRTTFKISNNIISNEGRSSIIKSLEESKKSLKSSEINLTLDTPYKNLMNSFTLISQQFPNNSLLQLVELINNSMITELGIISSDIIFDHYNELEFSKNKIEELNEVIVEATQEYGASAIELGFVQSIKNTSSQLVPNKIDTEDQFLAELGLHEFFNNLDSNDR